MTTSITTNGARRTGLLALGVAALLSVGLLAPSLASAQTQGPAAPAPTSPAPAAPAAAAPADVSVEFDDGDDEAREGEEYRYRVVVRNDGATVARGVGVRITLPEDFDVDDRSDESRIVERGDDTYDYAVGELAPGQEVTLAIEGEFEEIDRDEDNDRLEATAEVWNTAAGSGDDDFDVRVRDER